MQFAELCHRLLRRLRRVVESGAMTESALAKRLGVSQSHLNNTFKGVRSLTLGMADQILASMQWTVWDLCDDAEIRGESGRRKTVKSKGRELPLRSLGEAPCKSSGDSRLWVPRALLAGMAEPALFAVGREMDHGGLAAAGNILLADAARGEIQFDSVYIVSLEAGYALRWLRKGGRGVYLIGADDWQHPLRWARAERVAAIGRIHGISSGPSGAFLPPAPPDSARP